MKVKYGVCKLTQTEGKFIKSHIIPQALTRPIIKSHPMIEIGKELRKKKAWSSWYDYEMVTQNGEDILTEFDTKAILELRKHKLVWSSFINNELGELHEKIGQTHVGIRQIKNLDFQILRLFFLSLLWRACESNLDGFKDIKIPKNDLEKIRQMLLNKICEPYYFYPIRIYQLSTVGEIHNHTPVNETIEFKKKCPITKSKFLKIIRFYFDGLIVHIHLTKTLTQYNRFGNLMIGNPEKILTIVTLTYEESFQKEVLTILKNELI